MQAGMFPSGGYYAHKITFSPNRGRYSAWYDASGKLLDAEYLNGDFQRDVKPHSDVWKALQSLSGAVQTTARLQAQN